MALALTHHACGHLLAGEELVAQSSAEEAIVLSREHGFVERLAIGRCIRGIALVGQRRFDLGIGDIQEGLAALRAHLSGCFDSWFYTALALAYGKVGRAQEGLATIDRALAIVERGGGQAFYLAEVHRIRGELLLMQDARAEAEAAMRYAINISRAQRSRLLELRATMSLFRLLAGRARRGEARALLAEIYQWFTEGFDTADLKDAKALLAELVA